MKYLKRFSIFLEDGTAAATTGTAGMGGVSSAQPGAVAGTTGTTGTDISFYFKKGKGKKGDPSQVSDMRDLTPAKGITKVEEIKESKKELNEDENNIIQDCLVELLDLGFEINTIEFDSEENQYDIDDNSVGKFKSQELRISLYKQIQKVWRGNVSLRYLFDKNEVYKKRISTMRSDPETNYHSEKLEKDEGEIVEVAEDVSNKLINLLDYSSGRLDVEFLVSGSAMPFNSDRNINVNIHFVLQRIDY